MTDDTIFTNTGPGADGNQCVTWSYKEHKGTMTAYEARQKGRALMQAAIVAQTEGAIAKLMLSNTKKKARGFGPPGPEEKKVIQTLGYLRTARVPLMEGVDAIFGSNTRQEYVDTAWFGEPMQFHPDEALTLASRLLECAESVEVDGFLKHLIVEELELEPESLGQIYRMFADYRDRAVVEGISEQ